AAFPSWAIPPGDPGSPVVLYDHFAVYLRGAATLEALRERVGDDDFFSILRAWAREHRQGNATTEEFISLAEHESGLDLGHFFEVWLFEPTKPSGGWRFTRAVFSAVPGHGGYGPGVHRSSAPRQTPPGR